MANTTIVPTEADAVKTVTVEEVDALMAAWQATCDAEVIAFTKSMTHPTSLKAVRELKATLDAEKVAHAAWKQAEQVLQAQWRQEDSAYETFLCEQFDAMDNAIDYPESMDASLPVPYQITSYGYSYLDHHYQTHA